VKLSIILNSSQERIVSRTSLLALEASASQYIAPCLELLDIRLEVLGTVASG